MNLNYTFKNSLPGTADGMITINLSDREYSLEARIVLCWGVESEGAVSALPEYTPIATLDIETAKNGYLIDKELCIPKNATLLLAKVSDGELNETATFTIPEEKLPIDRGSPLYTVGFASDFHVGGWGSEREPKEGLIKAREQFNTLVDFLVTEGDLIQWHGCYSGEEFKKYNFNRETNKWGDNGERDPQFVEIGQSQWEMLEDYMAGFTIPVYHCQGNHDVIDEDHWSPMCGNRDYFGEYLTKHIKGSEESGKYEHHIERDVSVHYYETTIKGHKFVFTEAPHPHSPHDVIGEKELQWLDRVLFDGEDSGKPIFVMGHSPIDPRLNKKTAYASFKDLEELKKIFAKHPSVIYVSGHSHYTLDTPLRNVLDGRQETPSHLHNGGMTTIIDPPPMTQYNITHGTVAEVYPHGILIKGRNFTTAEWISLAHTELTFKKPCLSGEIGIDKSLEGETAVFTAKADNTDGISFEWYLNGELISEGKSIALQKNTSGYIALRATDEHGGLKSIVYSL